MIMVRTRGLGRALGRAIGKVLGKKDTKRVVEDPPMATKELNEEQLEAPVEEVVTDVEGFPDGPHDTSVLRDFENHITLRVCNGEERPELKLSSHGRKMAKFERPTSEIEDLVATSGLNPLIVCSLDTGETSSFHLPIEEVTITLDDVVSLLHLSVVGACHSFKLLHVDDAIEMLVELLEFSAVECHGSYVRLSWLREVYEMKIEACHWTVAWGYAWGTASLVHMYDNLNDASKSTMRQLAGYITLLQCWIYEHFSSVGSAVPAEDYDERRPSACRWTSGKALPISTYWRRPDKLILDAMCWIPYSDHRLFREFDVISLFSGHILLRLHSLLKKLMIDGCRQLCAVPGHCSPNYMGWFYMISHPFIRPAQPGDPPRVPPVQQYENLLKQICISNRWWQRHLMRQTLMCDDFVSIGDKLERLLNLRILTKGTGTYTVVEECEGIAKSYIGQPTVGNRSRRRWRMDGH
ncbi:Protein MAIN-LIKE 1 [Glycine soja]